MKILLVKSVKLNFVDFFDIHFDSYIKNTLFNFVYNEEMIRLFAQIILLITNDCVGVFISLIRCHSRRLGRYFDDTSKRLQLGCMKLRMQNRILRLNKSKNYIGITPKLNILHNHTK